MNDSIVGSVGIQLNLNQKGFDSAVKSATASTENAFKSSMSKVGKFIAAAFSAKVVYDFGKASVDAASKMQSAWTGLNSIVQGTGNSFSKAQKFITDYTQDGLMSVNEAVTAYKNLLSRGYDTTQIEKTMTALKDSAAFGRQASYDLGEAVVSATEGLKNENSILVDNAGITKNVAKMWEDWAKAHGTTTAAMTQAQKIEAEYNGILQETKFQTGDAVTYTQTFAGQMQRLSASFTNLKVAVGRVVTPIAQLFIPVINGAVVALTNLFNGIYKVLGLFGLKFPEVVKKSGATVSNLTSDIAGTGTAAVAAAKKINKAFSNVDEINVLKTTESGGSDSGSAGGGGGVSTPIEPTIASDDAVSAAVDGTVGKIMKYIEPLKNISFDNLINSFKNLWDSMGFLGNGVLNLLSDFYFKFLVPMANYYITDALPHFFNSTADAINKINFTKISKSFNELWEVLVPFNENIGNGLLWLYDNVLLPLTTWTINDLLPAFFDLLSGALSIVNQAITDFTPIWQVFWDDVLAPIIDWTGGVIVSVLSGIGDALKWISDNQVAMSIIEGVGIAIGVVSGALAIYNVAMTTCNAVTGIFSGIMTALTSPIAVGTAAIALLTAGIILLIKNWDKVKEVAINCWNKIKEVWSIVATWFNNTIIEPISNFFSSMWEGLKNGALDAWEGIKNVFSTVASFFKNIFTNAWEGVKAVFSIGGRIFDGIKEGIISAFKTVVNGIISGINKVVSIPFNGLNKALDKIQNVEFLGITPFSFLSWRAPVPEIPLLANGGYVERNNPQLAIVGDNKREGEITTPESKIYEQVDKALKENQANGKQQIEITLYHKYEDGRTIIQKINQAQIDSGEVLLVT